MNQPLTRREAIRRIGLFGIGSGGLLAGAKVPANGTVGAKKLLHVTYSVANQIQPITAAVPYYYFVLINLTDDPTDGPVPKVGLPWGNGIAAASRTDGQGFVGFVQYDPQNGYQVYANPVNTATNTYVSGNVVLKTDFIARGQPDTFRIPQAGEASLDFTLDLGRLKKNPSDAAEALPSYAVINIVTTDNIPVGADDAHKYFDALGNGTIGDYSEYAALPIAQTGYSVGNSTLNDEPSGDVRDWHGPLVNEPNLDIVGWQAEILQQ